jgi:hypothetical protein
MAGNYALWRTELNTPTPPDKRQDRPTDPQRLSGFWRSEGARTKPDYPVAIWSEDGSVGTVTFFKVGAGSRDGESAFNTIENPDRVVDFMSSTWLKSIAVTEADYHKAMETGRWPSDDKTARQFSETEKLGLEPATPADRGGNMPPEEAEADLDNQIIKLIDKQLDRVGDVKFPLTKESAAFAADIVDKLRGLGKQGEPRRKAQKQPHMDAAAAVDAKWSILKNAIGAIERLVTGITAFTKAEEARLRREQEAAAEAERKRLRDEAEVNARNAAEAAAREALARGEAFEEPTPEAIAEQVEAEVEQQIAAAPPPEPVKVVVRGSEQGRAISKAKRKVGVITDADKFIAAIKGQSDFKEWLQDKANKLARANTALDGMEIKDE